MSAASLAAAPIAAFSFIAAYALLSSLSIHSLAAFMVSFFFLYSKSSKISLCNSSFSANYSYLISLAMASTAKLAVAA